MTTSSDETIQVLQWARGAAATNDIVAMFWERLCDAVNEPATASVSKVYAELRAYGGNSIANFFRGDGVPYPEVAYDVAEALRPSLDDRVYRENDIESCEAYVLSRMEVKDDDIRRIAAGVNGKGEDEALGAHLKELGGGVAVRGAGVVVAQQAAKAVGAAAAERAMAEAGKQVAKKAAQKAAEQAAREVAKQVLARLITGLNIFFAAWTLFSIAGPARRVIIPGVTYLALLRKLYRSSLAGL